MIEMNCPKCGKMLRIPDEYAGVLGRCNGCGDSVQVPGIPRLDGPTTSQAPSLSSSDIANAEISPAGHLSRNDSIGIDMAVSQREMARAHKDMAESLRKQTLMSRLTCGCLILTVTAPIWIVGIVFFATMGFTAAVAAIATFFGIAHPVGTQPDPLPVVVVNEPAPVPEPAPMPEPLPMSKAVYSDATHYHPDRNCSALSPPVTPSILQTALEQGKQPCPVCAPDEPPNSILPKPKPAPLNMPKKSASVSKETANEIDAPQEEMVSVGQVGERYHKANCSELHGIVNGMPLSKALSKGLTACPKCKPAK